jgi:hypothetical protein
LQVAEDKTRPDFSAFISCFKCIFFPRLFESKGLCLMKWTAYALSAWVATVACISLAPAFAASEMGSGVEQMPHYSLQHHDAPQPSYAPTPGYASQQPAYVPNYQPQGYEAATPYEMMEGAPEAQAATPAPVYGTHPDGLPDSPFSKKVNTWKDQYGAQNPHLYPHGTAGAKCTNCAGHAPAAQPGRFAASTGQLKFSDNASVQATPGHGHKKRPSSLFSPIKEMKPYPTAGGSTYFE